ncbi:MAG: flagellar basal body-associated FliL family protein [Rhodospirillales bacterium]|nr:flagellar basal body-associated FliL family protein [Rhodospirillales bacterium]
MAHSRKPAADGEAKKPGKGLLARVLQPIAIAAAALVFSVALLATSLLVVSDHSDGAAQGVSLPVAGPIIQQELPEFVADLDASGARSHYLQIAIVVELPQEAVSRLKEEQAQILSEVQSYLRDLNRRDLFGSAGIERVRVDVRAIVDRHIAPTRTRDVYFTKFLVD